MADYSSITSSDAPDHKTKKAEGKMVSMHRACEGIVKAIKKQQKRANDVVQVKTYTSGTLLLALLIRLLLLHWMLHARCLIHFFYLFDHSAENRVERRRDAAACSSPSS